MNTRTSALTRWRGISTCRRSVGVGVGNVGGSLGKGLVRTGAKAGSAGTESLEDRGWGIQWDFSGNVAARENHCQCLIKVF